MGYEQTVEEIYAAFGRGDVAAILERLDESVEWEYGTQPGDIPWLQPRHGKDGAAEFFASLVVLEIHSFVPKAILGRDRLVVALVDIEATVKATGKRFTEEDEVHLWHFGDAGKIVRFRHRADTLQQHNAWKG